MAAPLGYVECGREVGTEQRSFLFLLKRKEAFSIERTYQILIFNREG
jgi:hypothetical protein